MIILMTMKMQKTTVVLIAILVLTMGVTTLPNALAGAGTVENYYWQANTDMCYNESSLDNLNFEDATGNGADVITEMEKSRSMYNVEMNGVTINAQGLFSCFGKHFDVQSEAQDGSGGVLAYEFSSFTGTSMDQSEIRFDSDDGWGQNSNSCTLGDIDVEWIMNHEMGHGIGLIHHTHTPANSVMHASCNSIIASLQSVDDTAIDIHYP